jgi:uncharacterized protein YutE (UPF0331/DUF86 family)
MGNHVVAEAGLGSPDDLAGVFECLHSAGVVPRDLHERTRGIAGLRNLLVHDYLEVDHQIVFAILGRLDDLVELAANIAAFVQKP